MEDEVERRTAVAQADLLQRRELVETGRGHGTAGYPGAALVPREEADVECRDQAEDAVGNQPVARPGKEVPRKEGPRGDNSARPSPARCRDTRANASAIGATDGSIIAAIIVTQTPMYQPSPPRWVTMMA